jgi:hypothetical protein
MIRSRPLCLDYNFVWIDENRSHTDSICNQAEGRCLQGNTLIEVPQKTELEADSRSREVCLVCGNGAEDRL